MCFLFQSWVTVPSWRIDPAPKILAALTPSAGTPERIFCAPAATQTTRKATPTKSVTSASTINTATQSETNKLYICK